MPQARLTFEVNFHGPVRVGTGHAGHGLDELVDPGTVVPGSSLKGLMRAEAVMLLGAGHELVRAVYGTTRTPSGWHWGDIVAVEDTVDTAARIRMDTDHGTAVDGALFLSEYHWPDLARFDVIRFAAIDPGERHQHELLLTASALSLRSIGGDRNRGFGWVDVDRVEPAFEPAVVNEITELIGALV